MESTKSQAIFLLAGEKDGKQSKTFDLQIGKFFYQQLDENIEIFEGFLLDKISSLSLEEDIWFDFRDVYSDHNDYKDAANLLLSFIEYYDETDIDVQAQAFSCVGDYHRFKKMIKIKKLEKKFDLDKLKLATFKNYPLLVLSDIGGSILYRCSERLSSSRKVDFQIKKHYHYYRPYFEDFLLAIMTHPRVKYGIYSSIMHRNILPLLFKIFERPKLRNHKTKIFEVFDQEYNVPDLGYDKKQWATKRKLEKVFQNDKVKKYEFGFSNTLLIDSEADKIQDYPLNSILVESYEEESVLDPSIDDSQVVLHDLKDFLFKLFEEADDVQQYLMEHPKYCLSSIHKIIKNSAATKQKENPEVQKKYKAEKEEVKQGWSKTTVKVKKETKTSIEDITSQFLKFGI
eukprot:403335095